MHFSSAQVPGFFAFLNWQKSYELARKKKQAIKKSKANVWEVFCTQKWRSPSFRRTRSYRRKGRSYLVIHYWRLGNYTNEEFMVKWNYVKSTETEFVSIKGSYNISLAPKRIEGQNRSSVYFFKEHSVTKWRFEDLNILIRSFCECAECFQGLSKAFHYPIQL